MYTMSGVIAGLASHLH